jgi:hypothetical protein
VGMAVGIAEQLQFTGGQKKVGQVAVIKHIHIC